MQLTRRELITRCCSAGATAILVRGKGDAGEVDLASRRPPASERRFTSEAVEATISQVKRQIGDPKLAWLFENCFPNTLDTTVRFRDAGAKPDTFVITGDINAMWLRDSSAQVWPYVPMAREDIHLKSMLAGVIRRQSRCILIDPYANAFLPDAASKPMPWAVHDKTEHKPGVGERKWELDSLCYTIRLAYGYWKHTGDAAPFDAEWAQAARVILRTFREQQRKKGPGPYRFQREAWSPTETLALNGTGNPALPVGMIFSMFRPSDDACIFSLFVPANLFAVVSLRQLSQMASQILSDAELVREADALADEVAEALKRYGCIQNSESGTIWAYEVDGYGGQFFMDDANVPSLLGLPYLGCCDATDPLYKRTRTRVLSSANPYFFAGSAAAGVGGPHEGLNMIWPMSIIIRALTSTDDAEIIQCLRWLKTTDAGTGFMHESFDKDDPKHYTRAWFAWANTLFGELILRLAQSKPELLARQV